MALGRQFENTYWHDDKGETRASILNPEGETEGIDRYKIDRKLTGANAEAQAIKHSAQGMLFSPETGTGMREDPLVPHATRIAAIQKGLGMDDPVKYAERAGKVKKVSGGSTTVGSREAKQAINLYTKALDTSTMPTHIIQKHIAEDPVLAVINQDMSRGHITGRNGTIRLPLTKSSRTWTEVDEHTVTRPSGESIVEPVNNTSLHKQTRRYWGSHEGAKDDVLKEATIIGPNGPYRPLSGKHKVDLLVKNPDFDWTDPKKGMDPWLPNPAIPKFNIPTLPHVKEAIKEQEDTADLDFRDLPEGYSMNVYMGKGDIKDPNIKTKDFKVWNGTTEHGPDSYVTMHTRDRVTEPVMETVTVPRKLVPNKRTSWVDQPTVVHELGHHTDRKHMGRAFSQLYDTGRSDPAAEGVADGIADVYSAGDSATGKAEYSRRMFTEGDTDDLHKYSGYTTDYSGFTNKTDKALYSAVRAHVSANPDPDVYNQMPSRGEIVKERGPKGMHTGNKEHRNIANQLLLGHLYDSHEHVRKTLAGLGYEKQGRAARKMYQDRDPNKPVQHHQPQLPGFEV